MVSFLTAYGKLASFDANCLHSSGSAIDSFLWLWIKLGCFDGSFFTAQDKLACFDGFFS